MPLWREYIFKIDGITPDTIPMGRLAEYMSDLAVMLGEQDRVHFVRLDKGSAVLVSKIEEKATPFVRERLSRIRQGDGPTEAIKASRRTNQRLKRDNATGEISENGDVVVIRFPGRDIEEPVTYGPFTQEGTLDGKVILVGGKSDPVPVHIEQGDTVYNCHAKRDIASALARHLFQSELRVRGDGRWTRGADGNWELNRFTINSFVVLDDEPLSAVVAKLREVPGNGWRNISDPWSELMGMRQQDGEMN